MTKTTFEEDCISRRDAINLFAHWAREGQGSFEDALMELPAYPKPKFIIDASGQINALPYIQQNPRMVRWIPTSERLPDDGKWCVFTDGKRMSVERFKTDAIDHFYPSGRWFELEDAKAWMPLPEMYREGDEV